MGVLVTDIQRFCISDGPGIRTTVFFKGCPLRCRWCHNPETQSGRNQLLFQEKLCIGCGACAAVCPNGAHRLEPDRHVFDAARCRQCLVCTQVCPAKALEPAAREMTPDEIFRQVLRDQAFYGPEGGMTLSGGEPLSHWEESAALLAMAKEAGLRTAVETCGYFDASPAALADQVRHTDLFLWDYKDSDPIRHRENTGVSPEKILRNLLLADSLGAATRLRCILIRGINLEPAHAQAIAGLFRQLKHCQGVDLLPYHTYGSGKAVSLGRKDNAMPQWLPEPSQIEEFQALLTTQGIPTRIEG